jgi:transposase InsO family protein
MRRYDKAFKEEAIRLSDEIGLKKAAEQLGIPYFTLQGWRKQKSQHGDRAFVGSGHSYASVEKTPREIELEAPNQKWLSDITEIPCSDGKLYLCPVLDCFNGEIVGLAMDDNMRKELCIQAFENACKVRNARGMIFHSDRGSQYTSQAFRDCLASRGAIQSMFLLYEGVFKLHFF